jgi:hypothetical protein
MKVDIKEEKNNLLVRVTLVGRKRDDKVQVCDTAKLLKWISTTHPQYSIAKTLKAPTKELLNCLGPGRLKGDWTFELKTKAKETTPEQVKQVVAAPPSNKVEEVEVSCVTSENLQDKLNIKKDNTVSVNSARPKSTKKRKTYTRKTKNQ